MYIILNFEFRPYYILFKIYFLNYVFVRRHEVPNYCLEFYFFNLMVSNWYIWDLSLDCGILDCKNGEIVMMILSISTFYLSYFKIVILFLFFKCFYINIVFWIIIFNFILFENNTYCTLLFVVFEAFIYISTHFTFF